MSISHPLLAQVLDAARAAQVDQAALAQAAGVAPETVSRAKKRGTIDISTLEALAHAAGLQLGFTGLPLTAPAKLAEPPLQRSPLANPVHGLAWSNPQMSADALVRSALRKGSFALVLEAVLAHGLAFVQQQWAVLQADADAGLTRRARADIDRKLAHIAQGLALAAA